MSARLRGQEISVTAEVIRCIEIDEYIRDDFRPLTDGEFKDLLESVESRGFLDPVTLWKRGRDRYTLVTGHHRFRIKQESCPRKPLKARVVNFRNIAEALAYAEKEQTGRRNLNAWEQAYRRGQLYLGCRRSPGPQKSVPKTADQLAKRFNRSPMSIKNDGAFAQGVDLIAERYGRKTRTRLLAGDYSRASLDFIRSIGRRTTPVEAFDEVLNNDTEAANGAKRSKKKAAA